jgi:hypothetical protein
LISTLRLCFGGVLHFLVEVDGDDLLLWRGEGDALSQDRLRGLLRFHHLDWWLILDVIFVLWLLPTGTEGVLQLLECAVE